MEIIITFETIYEILRKEKFRQEIQKLDPEFFTNLVTYLKEKQAILDAQNGKTSIFSQEKERTQSEITNIRKMIKELYEKREQKIIQLAMLSARTNNNPDTTDLLPEEKLFFESIKENLTFHREDILNNLLEMRTPSIRKDKPKDIKTEKQLSTKLIRFINAVPKFVAEDLNTYGPFVEEDTANLPVLVADLLIRRTKAEEISQQ